MVEVAKLKKIKAIFFDVDGVMTDGGVQLREDGEWVRRFNVRDGIGIKFLIQHGYHVCVITGAKSGDVIKRIEFLGIPHFYRGIVDKTFVFDEHLKKHNLKEEECSFIGDDVFDLPLIERCGFGVTVPNAVDECLEKADYITKREGGTGAVRELCDLVIKYSEQGKGNP